MYSIKSEDLKKEMGEFIDSSKPPKLKEEGINNLNRSRINETEIVIKGLLAEKSTDWDWFTKNSTRLS